MAKHAETKKEKRIVTINEKDREHAFNKLKELTNGACAEIKAALEALKPCGFCLNGDPKKKDEAGLCVMCAGKNMIRDHEQRKWGAEQVLTRVAPAPKSVEMKVDDSRGIEKLMEDYENKSPEEVDALLAKLRIPVQGEVTLEAVDEPGKD